MPASLTIEEAYEYIDSRPGWITLTTIGRDGMPHSIPIGYFREGDVVYVGGRPGTQKMKNAARNPNVSLLLQSGSSMQDIKGLMIQGTATVYDRPDDVLRLMRAAAKWRGVPEDQWPAEARAGAAYIGVMPVRMISWDYSREA